LTLKVGQIDLVFGVPSGFISRSVHAELQISVCNGCILLLPANIQTDIVAHTQST